MYKGIDVSSYNLYNNKPINWQMVKDAGVDFAILKVIRRDLNPDKQFENNWSGCERVGVTIQGVYNYSYATTVAKAISDAKRVLEVLGANRHPMIWLDVEDKCQQGIGHRLIDIINAYAAVINSAGCQFGVYTGLSFYNSYIRPWALEIQAPFWIARYPSSKTMPFGTTASDLYRPNVLHDMYGWQQSSKGRVSGISGNVDLNVWYAELEAAVVTKPDIGTVYQLSDLIRDSRQIWGVSADAEPAELLAKTMTISTSKNRNHAIVTPLERYMQTLGYYVGDVEADKGKMPIYGNGMRKATILYQRHVVGALPRNQDGIWSARKASWRTIYGA